MDSHTNDPRVGQRGSGYTVTREDGSTFHVLHTNIFGWTVCHGDNLDFVPTSDGGFAIGFASPDDAIDAVLHHLHTAAPDEAAGDPQTTEAANPVNTASSAPSSDDDTDGM